MVSINVLYSNIWLVCGLIIVVVYVDPISLDWEVGWDVALCPLLIREPEAFIS